MGCVFTAYTNGAVVNYVKKNLNINLKIAPTGVKNCHPEAVKFDIGVYFEANGHGSIAIN